MESLLERHSLSNRRNHICVAGTVVTFNIIMMGLISYLVHQLDHTEAHIDEIYDIVKSNCTF